MSTVTAYQPTPAHQLQSSDPTTSNNEATTQREEENIPRGPVEANLSFYAPPEDGSKPYNYAGEWTKNPPTGKQNNFGIDAHNVLINDLRNHEAEFTLDNAAFAALSDIPSQMKYADWDDEETIKKVYYPEVEELLLRNVDGASRVFFFDHTIRRPGLARAPVLRVHIDQTESSTIARVRHHLPDEANVLLQGRYRIINVWRPLNGAVVSHPLAVADSSSVRDEDLIGVEHRYPDRTGETAAVRFDGAQRWWYWSGMGDDERLLLKCFDSHGARGRVPHTAFVDPRSGVAAKGRESIEVRALVFG